MEARNTLYDEFRLINSQLIHGSPGSKDIPLPVQLVDVEVFLASVPGRKVVSVLLVAIAS